MGSMFQISKDLQESLQNRGGQSLVLIASVSHLGLFIPYSTRCPALNLREHRAQMEGKRGSTDQSVNPPQRLQCLDSDQYENMGSFFHHSIPHFTFFCPDRKQNHHQSPSHTIDLLPLFPLSHKYLKTCLFFTFHVLVLLNMDSTTSDFS